MATPEITTNDELVTIRDAETIRHLHGLPQYSELVNFWRLLSNLRLRKKERPAWENYLISLGITAFRCAVSAQVLAHHGGAEGLGVIARQIVEIATRFRWLISTKNAGYLVAVKDDVTQRDWVRTAPGDTHRPWKDELGEPRLAGIPPTASEEEPELKMPKGGCGIGMRAEYCYLCLTTHNHLTPLYAKANAHLDSDQMRSVDPDPPVFIERCLHIIVDAMHAAIRPILTDPTLIESNDGGLGMTLHYDAMREAFREACPQR